MGFLIYCDNDGCRANMEPLLDVVSNKAICTECNKEVKNVTHFAKVQMKSLGQVMKNKVVRQANAAECRSCKATVAPVLDSGKAKCGDCGADMNYLSPVFLNMLKNNI